jgi:transcription elongation factor Elf1
VKIDVTITDSKLIKVCPFCGSWNLVLENTHTPICWIRCESCGVQADGEYSGKNISKQGEYFDLDDILKAIKTAIDAWNKRV